MAMTNIKDLADLASTSLASYAYFDNYSTQDAALVGSNKDGGVEMTTEQSNNFRERFELVESAHQPNDGTGFSATLFDDLSTGKKVIALRGTEFTQGLGQIYSDAAVADALGIGATGFAYTQAVSMYRYMKQIKGVTIKGVRFN